MNPRQRAIFDRQFNLPTVGVLAAELRCNASVKLYPDGSALFTVADHDIFQVRGYQQHRDKEREQRGSAALTPAQRADNIRRAQRRARAAAFDIAVSSDFDLFVTLTLDQNKCDRYNAPEILRHLRYWLDNNVRRHGLRYLLVPEYHKDGAIHFHALFNDCLPLVDSGTVEYHGRPRRPTSDADRQRMIDDGGHVVYNLPAWGWGFTTAIKLYGNLDAAAGYVVKYITKSDEKIGGRWYCSGGDIKRADVLSADIDFNAASGIAEPVYLREMGVSIVRFRVGKEVLDDVCEALAKRV